MNAPAGTRPAKYISKGDRAMGGISIMVVDDHVDFRNAITEFLEEVGYNVTQACDGAEALNCIQSKKPHLVLLDVSLPKVDGYEVCRVLKAGPETASIPVVFLTGKTSLRDRLAAFVAGGHRFFAKPLDLNELEKWIRLTLHYNKPDGAPVDGNASFGLF